MSIQIGSHVKTPSGIFGIVQKFYGNAPQSVMVEFENGSCVLEYLHVLMEELVADCSGEEYIRKGLDIEGLSDGCESDPANDGPEVDILRAIHAGYADEHEAHVLLDGILQCRKADKG